MSTSRRLGSFLALICRVLLGMASWSIGAQAMAANLFVTVERPFVPNTPGAVIKMEVPHSRSVDLRLYRIPDPERFLGGQADLKHVEGVETRSKTPKADLSPRIPGPLALFNQVFSRAVVDGRQSLNKGLTPAARSLVAAVMDGPRPAPSQALPFLHGLELVERWDLACGEGDAQLSYCDLDIGPRSAGVYLVEAVAGGEVAHALAIFSRLSLVARRSQGAITILAADSVTGQALPDVHISITSQDQPVAHGVTGRQGILFSKLSARRIRVVGQLGPQSAVLEAMPVTAASELDQYTLLLTDRGEYRPSEQVVFHGFVRAAEERLVIPRLEKVEVSVFDARGSLFYSAQVPVSAQGGFGGEFMLPPGLGQGLYRIVANADGHLSGAEFLVRWAPNPTFSLQASLETPAAESRAQATVQASFAGKPMTHVQVSWRAVLVSANEETRSYAEEIDRGELTVGPDGRANFSFATNRRLDARYEVTLIARDSAGRLATAQVSSTTMRSPLMVTLTPERRLSVPGKPVVVDIKAYGQDHRPISSKLYIRVLSARSGATGDAAREQLFTRKVETGPDGRASLVFTPSATGYYEIEAAQSNNRLAEAFLYVTAEGGDIPFTSDTLTLVPEKPTYSMGETARILVLAPFEAATALLTVEGQDLVNHYSLPVRGFSAVHQVKITPALGPDFTVAVQAVFNERTWRSQCRLHIVPHGELLSVHSELQTNRSTNNNDPNHLSLQVKVTDRSEKPVVGAEVFAVVRDAQSTPAPAPSLFTFFHPPQLSFAVTESSTAYRNSNASLPLARAAFDGAEGYLPFKGLAQGPPRLPNAGTLLAASAFTDAHGQASFPFTAWPTVGQLSVSVRAMAGAAVGEWSSNINRRSSPAQLVAPQFLRAGDLARVKVRTPAQGAWLPTSIELVGGDSVNRAAHTNELVLTGDGRDHVVQARFAEGEWIQQPILGLPLDSPNRQGQSGMVSAHNPFSLNSLAKDEPVELYLSSRPQAAARWARQAMGTSLEPLTSRAIGRVLARVAQWHIQSPSISAEERTAALIDVAALVGLSHPEGVWGAFDGAAVDVQLTASALIALSLAKSEGIEIDEGLLHRGGSWLTERKQANAPVALALALMEEHPAKLLANLLAADRQEQLDPAGRALLAWALQADGARAAAREVASRLERKPLNASEPLRDTALFVLALHKILPRSQAIVPAIFSIMQRRGAGGFGGEDDAGLAALALALASSTSTATAPAIVTVETGSSGAKTVQLDGSISEERVPLNGPEVTLRVIKGGPVFWRLERASRPAVDANGPFSVERTIHAVDETGTQLSRPVEVGDRVEVVVRIVARAATPAVRIDDPYPAGLAPIEQEGEEEPFRQVDEHAQRIFMADRVIFLFSSLKQGQTVLRWQARASVAGTFHAAPVIIEARGLSGRSPANILTIKDSP